MRLSGNGRGRIRSFELLETEQTATSCEIDGVDYIGLEDDRKLGQA